MKKIYIFFAGQNILTTLQQGLRTGTYTVTAIVLILDTIIESIDKGENAV